MKKQLFIFIFSTLLIISSAGLAAADTQKDNPIDRAFAKDFEMASNTVEINYVAESYLDAWKTELNNVAVVIKKSYKYPEDKKRVDDYVSLYKKLGKSAFDLEMLNWIDTEQPASTRSFGTGGPGAALSAEARIYKQATLNLILHISTTQDNSPRYKYIYHGKGAQLKKLREQNR